MSASRYFLQSAQRAKLRIPNKFLGAVLPAFATAQVRHVTAPAYPGHIPLNFAENAFLAVGSAFMSLLDPRRGGICRRLPHGSLFTDAVERHDRSPGGDDCE